MFHEYGGTEFDNLSLTINKMVGSDVPEVYYLIIHSILDQSSFYCHVLFFLVTKKKRQSTIFLFSRGTNYFYRILFELKLSLCISVIISKILFLIFTII